MAGPNFTTIHLALADRRFEAGQMTGMGQQLLFGETVATPNHVTPLTRRDIRSSRCFTSKSEGDHWYNHDTANELTPNNGKSV